MWQLQNGDNGDSEWDKILRFIQKPLHCFYMSLGITTHCEVSIRDFLLDHSGKVRKEIFVIWCLVAFLCQQGINQFPVNGYFYCDCGSVCQHRNTSRGLSSKLTSFHLIQSVWPVAAGGGITNWSGLCSESQTGVLNKVPIVLLSTDYRDSMSGYKVLPHKILWHPRSFTTNPFSQSVVYLLL